MPLKSTFIIVFFWAGNSLSNEAIVAAVLCCESLRTAVLKKMVLLYIDCMSRKSVLLLVVSNVTLRITAVSGINPKLIGFSNRFHALVLMMTNPTAMMTNATKNIFLYRPNCLAPGENSHLFLY